MTTKVPRKHIAISKIKNGTISSTDSPNRYSSHSNGSDNEYYHMNSTHTYLKHEVVFNSRNIPESSLLRDQTSIYNAKNNSYTIDI